MMKTQPPLQRTSAEWVGVETARPFWANFCHTCSTFLLVIGFAVACGVAIISYNHVHTERTIDAKLASLDLNVTLGVSGNGTGVNCWDLDEDGTCDLLTEDTNNDGICSVLDCRGANGTSGANGTNGSNGVNGADGQDGTHCWDLNTNGVCDLGTEDTNSDGICSVLDCRGTNGTAGGNTSSICESGCETLSVGALNVTTGNNWFNGTTTLQNVVVTGDFQTLGGDIDIEAGEVAIAGTIFLSGSVTAYAPVVISGQLSASGATVLNRLNVTTGDNWLNGTTTVQNLVITGSTSLGSSLVLPSLNITTGDNWFNGTTTLETLVCNTVSSSGSITGGSLHTSGLIVGNIVTVNSISTSTLTASGSIVGNNINATTGPNFFNGNTTLQNLTVVQKAWVSTLDASGAITAASLDTGSGAIQTTGTGSFGAVTCTSVNAGSGTIQTTGTGSFGAITGTSLNVGSGALTAGAVSCSSVNSGSGTIQTTGTGSFGAITGTSLNIGSGALTAGAVGCTSVNAGSGTIQTTGSGSFGAITGTSLNAGSGTIQTSGTGSFGALTSTSLNAGSGTVQTTGAGLFGRINVTAGHNWINGTSTLQNLTVTSISSLQATTVTTLDASGAITAASLNTGSGAIQTTGSGSFGALTSTSLNAGSGTVQTTGAGRFGSLNVTSGHNWINGTSTLQNLTVTSISSLQATTVTTLDASGAITGASLNTGSGAIQTTGSGSFGALTSTSLNAGSGTIQTSGTGSFGAITGTSLNVGSGGVTGGAVSCSSVNSGSGTIQTTGTGSFGAITGTSLNVGSGALTAGAVSCSSVNSGSGTIQTTGTGSFGAITGTSLNIGSGSLTAGAITGSSVNAGSGTVQTTGALAGGSLTVSGATVLNRINVTTGNNWINGTTTVQNLVITGTTTIGTGIVLPSLNISTGNNWFNGTSTLQALTVTGSSSLQATTCTTLGASGVITGASLDAGSGAIQTTGSGSFGALTSTSVNAGSGTIQTTGTGSFGAITGTSLNVGSGALTAGAVSCSSVNSGSGTIQTTGTGSFGAITGTSLNVGSGALTAGAVSCSSVNSGSGTIQTTGTGSFGAITGTSLNVGSGALTAGAVGCSSVNAGSGTIQTTGSGSFGAITGTSLNAGSGTIQTTGSGSFGAITGTSLNAGSGTIQTSGSGSFGAVTATSVNSGSGTVQTTGAGLFGRINVTAGHNWINGTSTLQNLTVTSISSLQTTTCTTLDASGAITGASLNVGSGALTAGAVSCSSVNSGSGTVQTTGSGSFGAITGTSLNVGSGAITAGAVGCSSVNAGSGTIQTTGSGSFGAITGTSLNAGSGTIQTTGSGSFGAITGTSLNAGSGTIQTTGSGVFGPLMGTSLDAGSGYISTSGILQGSFLKITSPTAVVGSSAVTFPPYTITAVDTLYPSVYVTGGLTTRGGIQHDGDAGILHRTNVWRNSTGSDLVYNTSFPAWDFFADVNLYDKFVVRRAPSGSSVASWSELFRVGTLGGYFANNLGIGVPASNTIGLTMTPSLRQSISSNASHYGAYLQPVLGALINARVPLVSSVYVDTNLGTNIGIVDAAYGVYVSEGSTNATVTAGYGLYVKHPAFGTSKTTAYFENTVTVGGAVTCASLDAGAGTIKTTGQAVIGSSSVYSYLITAVGSYPSMFLASTSSTLNAHAGIQHNGVSALFFRNNVWRNSSGSDVLRNTSYSAWDFYTDISADKLAVRRSASGSTVASFTDLFTIDSSGNVSVTTGTMCVNCTTAARPLHVKGGVASGSQMYVGQFNDPADTSGVLIGYRTDTAGGFVRSVGGQPFFLGTQGTSTAITIDNSGNVGFGTSPSYQHHVQSSSTGIVASLLVNTNSGTGAQARFMLQNDRNNAAQNQGFLGMYSSTYSGTLGGITLADMLLLDTAGSSNQGLMISTESAKPIYFVTNSALRARIDSSGNFGLGAAPLNKFHVNTGTNINFGVKTGTLDSSGVCLQGFNDAGSTYIPMEFMSTGFNWGISGSTQMGLSSNYIATPPVLELGSYLGGNADSYVDLHAAASVDFSARVIRYSGTNGAFQLYNAGTGSTYISQAGAASIYFETNGVTRTFLDSNGHFRPYATNTYQMGISGSVWKDIYCANTVIQTSDAVLKTDITNTSLGLDFIQRLRPVTFRFKNYTRIEQRTIEGTNETENVTIQVTHKRYHEGLIAQEVAQVLRDVNVSPGNAAMYIDPAVTGDEGNKGLRYGELISPLIKAVQELSHLTPPKWAPGAPTSSVSPCTPGAVQYTETYLFICVSVDRWSRLALEQSW